MIPNVKDIHLTWEDPLSIVIDSVDYLIFCQAQDSQIKHTLQYNCSTDCYAEITELSPNKNYTCCVLEVSLSGVDFQPRKRQCINTATLPEGIANNNDTVYI